MSTPVYLWSTPRVPRRTWWPQCRRTAKRSGRLATASSACHTELDIRNCKARPRGLQGKRGLRRSAMLHGDIQPAPNASVPYGGVLDYGMAAELPGRAHRCAPGGGCQSASWCLHASTTGNGPCTRHLRGRAVQCGYCWICVAARPPATACGMGVHLGGHGGRQRLRGQNEPAEQSDDCSGASGLARGG